uniref:Uncharacterized protein n=1 Tax=viral metagenome TaxID=1070528 RepID=A0A6M3L6J7_9ZZZZ
MSDHVYPRLEGRVQHASIVPDSEIADVIVTERENGRSKLFAYTMAVAVCRDPAAAKRVMDEVDAEIAALAAIDVSKCRNEDEYDQKIGTASKYLNSERWRDGMLLKYGAESFEELKAALVKLDEGPMEIGPIVE